jgi:hypothetical protein
MKYAIYVLLAVALVAGILSTLLGRGGEAVMCPADALLCADGSFVGRSGPDCEFQCPATTTPVDPVSAHIAEKADRITLTTPAPQMVVGNPITITGAARGLWYFEASFPIMLTDWDGRVIAKTTASAQGDWMTEEFVPFTAELGFPNPYKEGDPDFMKRGSLVLQKSNLSGLPEHDDAFEIPIYFAE